MMRAIKNALVNHYRRNGGETMKTYLAQFTIIDGVHEHSAAFMVKAETLEDAIKIAESQEHDAQYREDEEHLTCWDYGDGMTAAQLNGVNEITKKEADILEQLGVAYYFN